MKKILLLMLLAISIILISSATAEVIFTDEMTSLDPWSEASNASPEEGDDVGGIQTEAFGDGDCVQMNSWWDSAGWTEMWRDTGIVMETGFAYNMNVRVTGFADPNITLVMSQIDSGSNWTNLVSTEVDKGVTNSGEWVIRTAQLNTLEHASATGKTLGISVQAGWWNNLAIDLITVDTTIVAGPAHSPDPLPGEENVGVIGASKVDVLLKWKTGLDPCDINNPNPNIVTHQLYIAPNSIPFDFNFTGVTPVNIASGYPTVDPNASYLKTDLEYNQLYYWRVDEMLNDDSNYPGTTWSFTTVDQAPQVTDHPEDILIEDGENVSFNIDVISASTPIYNWYKSTDAVAAGDTKINNGGKYSGADTNTLTITGADKSADDLWYYCVVGNTGSAETDTSELAHLWFEDEIARWKLNNNLSDDTGNGWAAQWDGTLTPVAGTFDGDAIEGAYSVNLPGDPNTYLTVNNSNDYFNHYVIGLTASCWVKQTPVVGTWQGIMAKQSRSSIGGGSEGWVMESNGGIAYFRVRGAGVDLGSENYPVIDDGNWHMLTGVYDPNNSNARFYIDGLRVANNDSVNTGAVQKTPLDMLIIGGEDPNDGNDPYPFDGLIDDVRIYTYPLSSTEVADMYVEHVTDATICIDSWAPKYDLVADCKIDFKDIAYMAGYWLECHLYPASRCDE
jgi:hypothetical protein